MALARHQPSLEAMQNHRLPRPRCTPWQCCRFFKRSSCRWRSSHCGMQRIHSEGSARGDGLRADGTFPKCMDAALSPLRASGMRILNYLDDWQILTPSRDTLLRHIDTLLRHLESLGLCVNMQKSILIPSQSITYLGVCFDSVEMRVSLSQERSATILSSLRHFRLGSSVHLKKFQRLLGHGIGVHGM